MSLVTVLAIAAVGAAVALLAADRREIALLCGLVALAAMAVASVGLDQTRVSLAGVVLAPDPFVRLILVFGSLGGLALTVIGLAAGRTGALPAATLATLGALGVALAATDPLVAMGAAAAAGLPGVMVALRGPGPGPSLLAAARHARAVVLGSALAIVAAAVVGSEVGAPADAALAAGYVAVAVAVAVRLGAIPFHVPAAHLARSAPTVALPLLLAVAPTGLTAVALAWTDGLIAPLALPLDVERGVVVAIAALSLVFGGLAAWLAEDVERAVGYLTLQSAGYLVLAMAAFDPAGWQPSRTWLLVFVLVTTALGGWAVALRATYGTGRIEALDGWARRTPLLAVALALIAIAVIGWPGSPIFEARLTLVRLAVSGPLEWILILAGIGALATYVRLALAGIQPAGPAVAGASGGPARLPAVRLPGSGPVSGRFRALGRGVVEAWRAERIFVAGVIVVVLALGGLVAAAGGLGVQDAAKAPAATTIDVRGAVPSFGPIQVQP